MSTSRVRCHGCEKWFSHRGLSQHLSKTQWKQCRDALAASRVPRVSSSIQRAATPPLLTPNYPSPVSTGVSDTEIAVIQGTRYFFSIDARVRTLPTITDDTLGLEDNSIEPADVADADAYEEILRNNSTAINPDQMTTGEAPAIPEPTEREDQSEEDQREMGDHADLTPPQGVSTLVVDKFPFGSPGVPISDRPQGSPASAHESRHATSMDSPWAPFKSELDWITARWAKMRGPSSTAMTQLLAMPGVRHSHWLITIC